MLDIEKVLFTDDLVLNKGSFLLVDMKPAMDGETTERIGTDIVVALTGQRYEKITIRVPYLVTCSAFNAVEVQPIKFKGFEGHFQWDDVREEWVFSATAEQFQLADEGK